MSSPGVVTSSSSSSNLDTSTLTSQTQQGDRGDQENRPQCSYCHRWGHAREKCYKLHSRPPQVANVIQLDLPNSLGNQS